MWVALDLQKALADLGGLEANERAAADDLPDDPRKENQKESNDSGGALRIPSDR